MLYIKKADTPPVHWDDWFKTASGRRSYNYGADYVNLPRLPEVRMHLLEEQNFLCAYCLQKITDKTSSIEHVIPKEFSVELSTCYTNLVAVCKVQSPDIGTRKLHCDKQKQSELITPFIFSSDCQVTEVKNNSYFTVGSDGLVRPKESATYEHRIQAEAYINTLNLNHSLLKGNRAKVFINALILGAKNLQRHQIRNYWEAQFKRIYADRGIPFRELLLIFISDKCGRH